MKNGVSQLVFLIQFASTLFMVGVIWFVQLVHYPLFGFVGQTEFSNYEMLHRSWITWVVAPAMLIEGISAAIAIWYGYRSISDWMGVVLLGIIWGSTAFIQIPYHSELTQAYDAEAHQSLINSNWIRTAAWSLRGAMLFRTAWKMMN